MRLIPGGNVAGTLYGTVLVTSVLATFEGTEPAGWVIAADFVTAFVFALAHAWAHAMARSVDERTPVGLRSFRHSLTHEWPIVESALPAALALVPAVLGIYSVSTGLWVAVSVNVALLFVWGAGLRQLAGGTSRQIFAAGLASALLGFVLVLLKLLVH